MTEMRIANDELPKARAFYLPAEWIEHAASWTSWPFADDLWLGYLEGVRREFTNLVATIARFEPVYLNVRDDEAEFDARQRLSGIKNIHFHRLPLNDVWFRDNGPLFVKNAQGKVALTDWEFNAWGEKYQFDKDNLAPEAVADLLKMKRYKTNLILEGGSLEINSLGTCLTTRSCLRHPKRNPELNQLEIEAVLHDYLGIKEVIWLEDGLEGDHTDGHIDTIVRFVSDRTIVCSVAEDQEDTNYVTMQRNLRQLQALRNAQGEPYRVVELPLPQKRRELDGQRLPLTYANFYIGNGFVAVPLYNDVNDQRALDILRPLFPGREVIGLVAENLITGGGAFHCVTQQQPQGEIYRG